MLKETYFLRAQKIMLSMCGTPITDNGWARMKGITGRWMLTDDGSQVLQWMGFQCTIRVFNINRDGDGTKCAFWAYGQRRGNNPVSESKEPLYMISPIGLKVAACAFTSTPLRPTNLAR